MVVVMVSQGGMGGDDGRARRAEIYEGIYGFTPRGRRSPRRCRAVARQPSFR